MNIRFVSKDIFSSEIDFYSKDADFGYETEHLPQRWLPLLPLLPLLLLLRVVFPLVDLLLLRRPPDRDLRLLLLRDPLLRRRRLSITGPAERRGPSVSSSLPSLNSSSSLAAILFSWMVFMSEVLRILNKNICD